MIEQRVKDFVKEYQALTRTAANEEELRSAFNAAAISKLNIRDLKLERGRQDLRRNKIIIEFKGKGLFGGTKTSQKFKEAESQLSTKYIPSQARLDAQLESEYIGICFDGKHLAYVFIERDKHIRVTELIPFNELSASTLVQSLDRDNRISLTPQNVIDDFGSNSSIAANIIKALWNHLDWSLHKRINRVEMLFNEWKDLFEQSTNLGKIGKTRINNYLHSLGLPSYSDYTRVLFVLHTYHALFFKLLAAEVVLTNTLLPGVKSDFCFSTSVLDDNNLMKVLKKDIEESELFRQVNILNFVEGIFFSWYLEFPSGELIKSIRTLMQRLSLYTLSGLQLRQTRDVVKRVYQELVPVSMRKNLAEYFTPEWLVEYVLDKCQYIGPDILNRKFLDPCCGSGNFIIHAINRYKEQAQLSGWDNETTLKHIIKNIYGFDLNPLAVLSARANYLIAISDLIATHSDVEIPIYQADAVYSPTIISDDEKKGITIRKYDIGTRKNTISVELPETLIQNNRLFARILEIMERAIKYKDSIRIFLNTVNNELAYIAEPNHKDWEKYLSDMYLKIEKLELEKWNSIWCRIIRNYFASVAIGECNYIASNPPWIRWSELPSSYANRIKPTCVEYGIFSRDGYFGGNELDISGMIAYTVADKWLCDEGGRMCILITQSHFQSQSSGGFRKFEVRGVPLKVISVDDFADVKPFSGLANKPAVLYIEKGKNTVYPVPYIKWSRTISAYIPEDFAWTEASMELKNIALEANRMDDVGQRWSILPPGYFSRLKALDGEDPNIKGRKGIVTDLNGGYFIELLGPGRLQNTVRFKNIPALGDKPVDLLTGDIESSLVYPLIKGSKDIRAFRAATSPYYVIIPNKRINIKDISTISEFGLDYPNALRYFRLLDEKGLLGARSTWSSRMYPSYDRLVQRGVFNRNEIPFFAIYDIGDYTFSKFKVVWGEIAGTLQAAVISEHEVPFGGGVKPVIPDHKVYFAPFNDIEYAHYVCALLNSHVVSLFADSFTIKLQVGSLFRHIKLPTFDKNNHSHKKIAAFSMQAHNILLEGGSIEKHREKINALAMKILGLST